MINQSIENIILDKMNILNTIICGDAVEVLKKIPDSSIDMVVTSPPYDDLRTYNGFQVDLHKVGQELFRVLNNTKI